MIAIFTDYIDNFMEVFMDDFSIFGSSFDVCLANLSTVLKRCEEVNPVLSWEKTSLPGLRRDCVGSQSV